MLPLNYAILKYCTTVSEACANDVIEALKDLYGNFKGLCLLAVTEALMTAEKNGLLEESRYQLDEHGQLVVYYCVSDSGRIMINRFIK